MKKLSIVCLVFCLSLLTAFVPNGENVETSYIIVINNFDFVEEDYKQKFFEIDVPLTFVTHDRSLYKEVDNIVLIDALKVPRTIMSVVATNSASKMRNTMYSATDIAKKLGKVVVIFDAKTDDSEQIYYAIVDSLEVIKNKGMTFEHFVV